jgi:tetratricopeptide (TPR) repeat protein
MRWRRGVGPLRKERISHLRYLARHDPKFARPLAVELLGAATDALERSRPDDALGLLDELVRSLRPGVATASGEPDNLLITALGLLGSALLELGRSQDAERALASAIALAPTPSPDGAADHHSLVRASNVMHLARCRELAGEPTDALDLLEQASILLSHHSESDPSVAGQLRAVHTMRIRMQRRAEE